MPESYAGFMLGRLVSDDDDARTNLRKHILTFGDSDNGDAGSLLFVGNDVVCYIETFMNIILAS